MNAEIMEREIDTTAPVFTNELIRSEIEQQIATAKRWPRSVKGFFNRALELATLNESIASQCIYALPRDGKTIEGPSARLAEIVASEWGNCRAGARIVDESGEFITAQGVFHDLEKNTAITFEVKRRITDKRGNRFKPDMIAVTGNAACSIALRNAVFKGVPKALWSDIYEAARKAAVGDVQTLANKRAAALATFQKYGVTPPQVFAVLGVAGEPDITLDHLATLRGMVTALKDGEVTPEEMFAIKDAPAKAADSPQPKQTLDAFARPAGADTSQDNADAEILESIRRVESCQTAADADAIQAAELERLKDLGIDGAERVIGAANAVRLRIQRDSSPSTRRATR